MLAGNGIFGPMVGEGIRSSTITWRVKDRLVQPRFPMIMGIINATPDSFHAPSRTTVDEALRTAERMLREGALLLDVGGASSRPGAEAVTPEVEIARALPVIQALAQRFPEALISIDTFHAAVARAAVEAGAGMVNDISAGTFDGAMLTTVAELHVPYVLMHMQGRPATMQHAPTYADVAAEVTRYLSARAAAAREAGIADMIIDPGFGFGKTTEHNYRLLRELERLIALGHPVLVGLSRKRMINEVLDIGPSEALNGTMVLNTVALQHGASILRVHDVKEAVQVVRLLEQVGR